MGHLLAGGVFCLLAGQPLTVLGCTGPVLIFEKILVTYCESVEWDYLTTRLWIGLWSSLFCIIIVAVDGSAIVRYLFWWLVWFPPKYDRSGTLSNIYLTQRHHDNILKITISICLSET